MAHPTLIQQFKYPLCYCHLFLLFQIRVLSCVFHIQCIHDSQKFVNTNCYVYKNLTVSGTVFLEAHILYEKLLEEKAEADRKKLFEAYKKSKRSLDEIVDFMKGKADI